MLFKNQYYYFVAGLPDFTFDSMKLPFTVEEYMVMLDEVLKQNDRKLLHKYYLKYDNDNLLSLLKDKNGTLNLMGKLSRDEIIEVVSKVKEELPLKDKRVPPYFEAYIKRWLDEENPHAGGRLWEDMLSSLYMDYGLEVKNSLMSGWFELNLNIGNVLSAIYARKYGMEVAKYIVGGNKPARVIRENAHARDFGLDRELEYFDTLLRISEEPDIYDRERRLDKFRWDWLEENTVFDYFNIEYLFAYLCKLQILERWVHLNAEEGERVFRELISNLKNETKLPEDL
ncbi:MAG: hypothetical protein A2W86_03430 [Bacteroidetes bacterium GWD2_45_23]|nr:MAG: hypothetical protein A2W87_14605 [Bacteroidetes bacterium GWC2_46_850]OFX86154.1 MAG: hypothetical protein A2W86_03430 [Bacteroidetes bacterium GWD2_45_23]HCC17285.1 DUF2764 domain-containing protein [Porphyromonadaceae bacterium]